MTTAEYMPQEEAFAVSWGSWLADAKLSRHRDYDNLTLHRCQSRKIRGGGTQQGEEGR